MALWTYILTWMWKISQGPTPRLWTITVDYYKGRIGPFWGWAWLSFILNNVVSPIHENKTKIQHVEYIFVHSYTYTYIINESKMSNFSIINCMWSVMVILENCTETMTASNFQTFSILWNFFQYITFEFLLLPK